MAFLRLELELVEIACTLKFMNILFIPSTYFIFFRLTYAILETMKNINAVWSIKIKKEKKLWSS